MSNAGMKKRVMLKIGSVMISMFILLGYSQILAGQTEEQMSVTSGDYSYIVLGDGSVEITDYNDEDSSLSISG